MALVDGTFDLKDLRGDLDVLAGQLYPPYLSATMYLVRSGSAASSNMAVKQELGGGLQLLGVATGPAVEGAPKFQ
jgi:hypothetical protein